MSYNRNANLALETEFDNNDGFFDIPTSAEIHLPISINGNSGLSAFINNNDLTGDGTNTTPYIIENFTISSNSEFGIEIQNTDKYLTIRNCTIEGEIGEYYGIILFYTLNVYLYNNTVLGHQYGIRTWHSNDSVISDNQVSFSEDYGFDIRYSNNITFSNNIVNYCYSGFGIGNSNFNKFLDNVVFNNFYGFDIGYSSDNYFSSNDVWNNTRGFYFTDSENSTLSTNNIYNNTGEYYGGIYFDLSNNNSLFMNNICNNSIGISFYGSNHNTVFNNNVDHNDRGISMGYVDNSTFYRNNISFNIYYGIDMSECTNNSVYQNDIYGNQNNQAYEHEDSANNTWDNGVIGNYWGDDYGNRYPNATNIGSIWNTTYEINGTGGGIDNFPLISSAFSPLFVSVPDDISTNENYTDLNVSWIVVNLNPASYTIELNGNEIVSATECVSGEDIYYDIPDGLLEGNHNITITVSDESGNIAQDTFIITVNVEDPTNTEPDPDNTDPENTDPDPSISGFSAIFRGLISIFAVIGIKYSIKKQRMA